MVDDLLQFVVEWQVLQIVTKISNDQNFTQITCEDTTTYTHIPEYVTIQSVSGRDKRYGVGEAVGSAIVDLRSDVEL